MEKERVSFDIINFYSRTIADRLREEGITHVIGLARGGLVPATIISYKLDVPLLSYAISSYEDTTKTDRFKVHQFVHFSDLKSLKEADPHVLVVDDICDTGETMQYICHKLTLAAIKAKYATLFTKKKHKKFLDHYGHVIPNNKWIVFPWE
tara:strand:+ start:1029 stop:1481 length:453 start_codon:yes stop_codon:yes gene_type:complete